MDDDGGVNEEGFEMRQKREDFESEQGFFLKPLYVQKTESKIYLYDNLVTNMRNEFRDRLKKKRQIIQSIKHRCRELSLKDVTVLCKQCHQELALLKTLRFVSDDLHHAKCAFGQLKRVEIDQIKTALPDSPYANKDNQDFCRLYMEDNEHDTSVFSKMEEEDQRMETMSERSTFSTGSKAKVAKNVVLPTNKYAFCECRNNHIVGIIKDNRFYFTDVSELQLMFPQGHYEDWCEEFWQNNYKNAFALQNRLNLNQAEQQKLRQQKSSIKSQYGLGGICTQEDQAVLCELCNKNFPEPSEFVLHCEKDKSHKDLVN